MRTRGRVGAAVGAHARGSTHPCCRLLQHVALRKFATACGQGSSSTRFVQRRCAAVSSTASCTLQHVVSSNAERVATCCTVLHRTVPAAPWAKLITHCLAAGRRLFARMAWRRILHQRKGWFCCMLICCVVHTMLSLIACLAALLMSHKTTWHGVRRVLHAVSARCTAHGAGRHGGLLKTSTNSDCGKMVLRAVQSDRRAQSGAVGLCRHKEARPSALMCNHSLLRGAAQ
jgi:hypothetical protein